MSERGGAPGAFVLGIAVGALLGLMFAPGAGDETRAEIARRMRDLRDLASEKADAVRALVEGDDEEDEEEAEELSAREELERKLTVARERRRGRRAARRGAEVRAEEDDEPLA